MYTCATQQTKLLWLNDGEHSAFSVVAHAHMHCQLSLTSFPLHSQLGRANNVHLRYYGLQYPITNYKTDICGVQKQEKSKKKAYK